MEERDTTFDYKNFNCTIQELKHSIIQRIQLAISYFNCTIQELKRKNEH